jgi:DNA-binding LacI/PurR family transcriptional regulator
LKGFILAEPTYVIVVTGVKHLAQKVSTIVDFAVSLFSVRQSRQELGRHAAELVVDESENPDHRHEQVTFTPELVARTSTLG